MEQRISLLTLGVDGLDEARAFFERGFGWKPSPASTDGVVFFQTGGIGLALFPRHKLAKDAGVSVESAGISVAYNCRSEDEVDQVFQRATEAGGAPIKAPQPTFWGGYSSYVRIPGGHLLEIAFNPHFAILADGALRLP